MISDESNNHETGQNKRYEGATLLPWYYYDEQAFINPKSKLQLS